MLQGQLEQLAFLAESPDRMQDVRLRRFLFSQSGRTVGAIDLHFLRNDDVVMQ
jgi:hypothetical protein